MTTPQDNSCSNSTSNSPDNAADVAYTLEVFNQLKSRSVLPLLSRPDAPRKLPDDSLPDLNNVQGDVIYLFPKKAENFLFFRIADLAAFRRALGTFKPTTSEDVKEHLIAIADIKANTPDKLHDIAQYQIAFSRTGLYALGVNEDTGDVRFDKHCMRDDKAFLGDQRDWDKIYEKPVSDPVNGSVHIDTGALHGVIIVAGSSPEICVQGSNNVRALFGSSITVPDGAPVEGRARPPPFKGHEHFGYEDGVSQPALRGLVAPRRGQIQVDPGVIVMGYKGDPVFDDPSIKVKRPAWTRDGTVMVYKKLEQSVVTFEDYLAKNGPRWREFIPGGTISPPLTDQEGAELFGARLMGRWKSGAPLAKCPFRDDTVNAPDANWNNDFDYVVRNNPNISPNEPSDYYCPFTIHTRKTAPRNLNPYIDSKYLEAGTIMRGGLPYGPEVTDAERRAVLTGAPPYRYDLEVQRGLLFVCYMSSLDNGFVRQTKGYAGNDYFPITSLVPQKQGQDPIIGSPPPAGSPGEPTEAQFVGKLPPPLKTGDQVDIRLMGPDGKPVEVSGFAKVTAPGAVPPPGEPNPFFVTSKGGEYFFVPSVSSLKAWASDTTPVTATVNNSPLDILLMMDTTGSMRKSGSQDSLQVLVDGLVGTGKWSKNDVRFGIVAFRDHPPQDQTYVVQSYPFTSDVQAVMSYMATLTADGGGDGPEAQCDALATAVSAGWKSNATKIALLITDSPPHGIGECEDKFPGGCPFQNDPIRIAMNMARFGITLHVLANEPTLSMEFSTALDFYKGLVQKTGGRLFGVADGKALMPLVLGAVRETADIEALVVQYGNDICNQAVAQKSSEAKISQDLYSRLSSAGAKLGTFSVEDIYEANSQGDQNTQTWSNAQQIDYYTRSQIRDVYGFRLKPPYRSGGSVQSMSYLEQPITLEQACTVVKKAMLRGA